MRNTGVGRKSAGQRSRTSAQINSQHWGLTGWMGSRGATLKSPKSFSRNGRRHLEGAAAPGATNAHKTWARAFGVVPQLLSAETSSPMILQGKIPGPKDTGLRWYLPLTSRRQNRIAESLTCEQKYFAGESSPRGRASAHQLAHSDFFFVFVFSAPASPAGSALKLKICPSFSSRSRSCLRPKRRRTR